MRPPIEDIKKVAEAATPGPWTNEPGTFWVCDIGRNMDDPGVWSQAPTPVGENFPHGSKEADAEYIATMDPQTTLQLIAYIEELERRLEPIGGSSTRDF